MRYYNKCCLRQTTDQLERHATTVEYPTVFLNCAVMRGSNLIKNRGLRVLDPTWHYGSRGSVRQYECPTCHRPMWCTVDEAHTPYMTCRQCDDDRVAWLYQDRHLPWLSMWTELMEACYDPAVESTAYATHGVDKEWLDPAKFCRWCDANLSRPVAKAKAEGTDVFMSLRRPRAVWCREFVTVEYTQPENKSYIRVKTC